MTTTIDGVIEEEFAVGDGAELSISNIAGRITVRAGEPGVIRMRATRHGRPGAVENTCIDTAQEHDVVTIRTRKEESGLLHLARGISEVEYDITVPVGCRVRAGAVSADVDISGTHGLLHLETVSGNARIEDVAGECTITTVSGEVRARGMDGRLTARSTSGDVTLLDSHLAAGNFHTVSGNVRVESPLAAGGHYYANTVSGDLVLVVPGDTGATIQMRTVSGEVHSELPAQVVKSGRRHWQGVVNSGGANVELHSVSGDLRILGSSPTPATPERPEAGISREEVAAVLSALEGGEIGVDEAMARIKGAR